MKRLVSLSVIVSLLLILFSPFIDVAAATRPSEQQSSLSGIDFDRDFLPAGDGWKQLAVNEIPATLTAEYQLAEGVVELDQPVSDRITDLGQALSGSSVQKLKPNRIIEQGGYIDRTVLDTATAAAGKTIGNGSVVVDKQSRTAFKVVSDTEFSGLYDTDSTLNQLVEPLENTYALTKPEMSEIFADFELTQQSAQITKGNIKAFAKNVELAVKPLAELNKTAVGEEDKTFKTLTGDNLIEFTFDQTPLQGKVGNSTITVNLAGGIAIGDITFNGRYTANSGYEFSLSISQECYLVVQLEAEVHEQIRVPLFAIDIPFGVGSVYGGIYALIGLDGSIQLGIEARETSSGKMGVKGSTFLYVPTSFRPIFEPDMPKFSGDCSLLGQINGYIKFGPMLGAELLGFDLIGAGVLLGAGVTVVSDGVMLDIELYATIDIYIALAGKQFNLVKERPTIYRKRQLDTFGYKSSFLEAYVNPGRIGGLIEADGKQGYVPAVGIPYRIWVVPPGSASQIKAVGLDPAAREQIRIADRDNPDKNLRYKVRTYPGEGFAMTNSEGEFFQEDPSICFDKDNLYLEYKVTVTDQNGKSSEKTLFVGPVQPTLPFTEVTITYADYFNDFIIGKVEPQQMIIWEANRFDPDATQTELTFYQGAVDVSPFNDPGVYYQNNNVDHPLHYGYVINGTAQVQTDAQGLFDTRDDPAWRADGSPIDVLAYEAGKTYQTDQDTVAIGVLATIKDNEAVNNSISYGIKPVAPAFQVTRTLNLLEETYQKEVDGDRIINRITCDELIWIANPDGTRTVTQDEFEYSASGFSTQDSRDYSTNPVQTTRSGPATLTRILDPDGQETGTALFAQRVTLEWVWQAHPNPIRITSADQVQATAGVESQFPVTATGFLPRFSLTGAPDRVWIDEQSGLLYLPQTLSPGAYTFTIEAREGLAITAPGIHDPKHGHDSSEPDQQTFTLTVAESPAVTPSATPSPSVAPAPSGTPAPTPTPTSAPEKPPVLSGSASLTMTRGIQDFTAQYTATGTSPIQFSVQALDAVGRPSAHVTIDPATGRLTVRKSIVKGSYRLTVTAANKLGTDAMDVQLIVNEIPYFAVREDQYQFRMSKAQTEFRVTLNVNGSTPLRFDLAAALPSRANPNPTVPSQVTLVPVAGNPNAVELVVKGGLIGGIPAGTYAFRVTAANDAGSAEQLCQLTVTASILPTIGGSKLAAYPLLWRHAIRLQTGGPSAALPDLNSKPAGMARPDLILSLPNAVLKNPPNQMTIRCDDQKDVYSHDRKTINGTKYLAWDATIKITLLKIYYPHKVQLSGMGWEIWGETIDFKDNSPVCDAYHYIDPDSPDISYPMTEEEKAAMKSTIEKAMAEKIQAYRNGYLQQQDIDLGGLRDSYLSLQGEALMRETSRLEFGALCEEIAGGKGGDYQVALSQETGSVVAGEYFSSLKANPQATLSFQQAGATMTFAGKDLGTAALPELLNLGFTKASHEEAMLTGIGAGAESYTYAFQHHGELPGLATFAIATPLPAGAVVQVYRFDAADGSFTLIAGSVKVGADGVVTYKNNAMSEYVVTTKNLAGTARAAVADLQGETSAKPPTIVWWLIVAALLILPGGGFFWLRMRKKARA